MILPYLATLSRSVREGVRYFRWIWSTYAHLHHGGPKP